MIFNKCQMERKFFVKISLIQRMLMKQRKEMVCWLKKSDYYNKWLIIVICCWKNCWNVCVKQLNDKRCVMKVVVIGLGRGVFFFMGMEELLQEVFGLVEQEGGRWYVRLLVIVVFIWLIEKCCYRMIILMWYFYFLRELKKSWLNWFWMFWRLYVKG